MVELICSAPNVENGNTSETLTLSPVLHSPIPGLFAEHQSVPGVFLEVKELLCSPS